WPCSANLAESRTNKNVLGSRVPLDSSGPKSFQVQLASNVQCHAKCPAGYSPSPMLRSNPVADFGVLGRDVEKHEASEERVGTCVGNRENGEASITQSVRNHTVDHLADDVWRVFLQRQVS